MSFLIVSASEFEPAHTWNTLSQANSRLRTTKSFEQPSRGMLNGKVVERQPVKLIDLLTSPTVLELQQGNSGKPRT